MARRSYAGAAAALTLASGINATDLTITTSGTVTGWPTGSGGKFLAVIARGTASEEKIFVSSRAGNVLTVASTGDRGGDGTGAASHAAGVVVEHCVGAVDLDEPNDHLFTTTRDDHTQYAKADGTRFPTATHDVTARHAFGAALGTPAAASTDSQTAAAAGSSATPARDDHVHLQPATTARGSVGYASSTTAYSTTTTNTDIGLTVTVTLVAGRRYKITAYVPHSMGQQTVALFNLLEGANTISQWINNNAFASTGVTAAAIPMAIQTGLSAGSHTFKVQGSYSTGGGGYATAINGGSANPAWILVEDIGT
jgi:hypothetical protein